MKHGVAMRHGGRTQVDFHPLGQGRSVCDIVSDLHRLPSCVLWARACALTCQTVSASEGVGPPRKAECASEGAVGQPLVVLSPSARHVCPRLRARRGASAVCQVSKFSLRPRGTEGQGFKVS